MFGGVRKLNKKWTKQRIIAEIKALAAEKGRVRSTDDELLYRAARKYFGTWSEACKAAETAPVKARKPAPHVRRNCLLYDTELNECKGLRELVCARRECSFYKRANASNREDYAAAVALIELNARRK